MEGEIDDLENKINELQQLEKDIEKKNNEKMEAERAEHEAYKKDKGIIIYELRDELESALENPNIIN